MAPARHIRRKLRIGGHDRDSCGSFQFRNVAKEKAPQAAILFDKFHIMRHLGEALDKVRKAKYARLGSKDRRFIKGQKYAPLSRRENLTREGKARSNRCWQPISVSIPPRS